MRIILCIVLLTGGLLQSARSQENQVLSGKYAIRYCGRGPGSKAAQLQALLPVFWDHLQGVLVDVKKGTNSKAFRAFFKSQANAAYVQSVFQRMADGANILIPGEGHQGSILTRLFRPSILCLDSTIPNWQTLKKVCDLNKAASTVPNREIILLCPAFWGMEDEPSYSECPRVRRNVFVPNDYRVSYNKFGAFVHEFTHAYIGVWTKDEVYKPMEAAKLDDAASLKNPNNYALYAASMFPLLLPHLEISMAINAYLYGSSAQW